jgi:hypothetical protein
MPFDHGLAMDGLPGQQGIEVSTKLRAKVAVVESWSRRDYRMHSGLAK